jgi:hypothetical protein
MILLLTRVLAALWLINKFKKIKKKIFYILKEIWVWRSRQTQDKWVWRSFLNPIFLSLAAISRPNVKSKSLGSSGQARHNLHGFVFLVKLKFLGSAPLIIIKIIIFILSIIISNLLEPSSFVFLFFSNQIYGFSSMIIIFLFKFINDDDNNDNNNNNNIFFFQTKSMFFFNNNNIYLLIY